jgi:hypothetical protein
MTTPKARFIEGAWLEIDVTATVAKWYRRGGNTGFLLANRTSSYTGSTAHNFQCNTRYSNPILRVDYRRIDIIPVPNPPFPR